MTIAVVDVDSQLSYMISDHVIPKLQVTDTAGEWEEGRGEDGLVSLPLRVACLRVHVVTLRAVQGVVPLRSCQGAGCGSGVPGPVEPDVGKVNVATLALFEVTVSTVFFVGSVRAVRCEVTFLKRRTKLIDDDMSNADRNGVIECSIFIFL